VNTLTGEGLSTALAGAQVVVDVSNSPSFEDRAVLEFFETSGRNLSAAEAAAGIKHHVALSVVGADRLPDSGYMRAKMAQEKLVRSSKIPYTIVRAAQFFEFLGAIGESNVLNGVIHLPPALMQPIAADDVAAALADFAERPAVNGIVEIAGPEPLPMYEAVRRFMASKGDPRKVHSDPQARYYGARVDDQSLTPGERPRLAPTTLEQWLGGNRG
jgi:uncharacterized protein YbjT (DUF2867 family)